MGPSKLIIESVPAEFEGVLDTVCLVRATLCSRYKTAEANFPKINEKAFDGVWEEIYTEYVRLAKDLEGVEVKMIEKRKFDSVEDSDMDDGHFLNNKRGRVD